MFLLGQRRFHLRLLTFQLLLRRLQLLGHLGPDAPTDRDGVCFIALARRRNQDIDVVYEKRITLAPPGRVERQAAASRQLLLALADYLDHNSTD